MSAYYSIYQEVASKLPVTFEKHAQLSVDMNWSSGNYGLRRFPSPSKLDKPDSSDMNVDLEHRYVLNG